MSDIIKCPSCGESNLPDQEYCQYCRTRLQPVSTSNRGADGPIKPGQLPTKKNTAELEPILPQWLRDARDSARKAAEDDASQVAKQTPVTPASSTPDLLAGLHSQSDNEEDETPDWLASITGAAPKSKKNQAGSSEARRVEVGDAKDFAKTGPAAKSETPAWLTGLNAEESKPEENNSLADWPATSSNSNPPPGIDKPVPFDTGMAGDSTTDWLKNMADESLQEDGSVFNPPSAADTPPWMRETSAQDDLKNNEALFNPDIVPPSSAETPDWLRAMGDADQLPGQAADSAGAGFGESEVADAFSSDLNVPEWLRGLPSPEGDKPIPGPVPSWLQDESSTPSSEEAVPAWLSGQPAETEPEPGKPEPFSLDNQQDAGDLPNWLQGASAQASTYEEPAAEQPENPVSTSSDTPDWLNTLKSADAPQATPAFSMDEPMESAPAAFTANPLGDSNADALFTEMPDWLSNVAEASPSSSRSSITGSDAIAPGELPSWVQAMRPVDTSRSPAAASSSPARSGDQTLESRGALAGLQGVLPSVPGYAPTSKPKAYSIKLQSSDEQQSHAALLEQILAAETEPVPIASFSALRTSRSLRWALSAVLLTILPIVLFARTQIFTLPTEIPFEIGGAQQVAQSIPEGASVLVAFDYEPARVGEMEAAAGPIFSLLRKPNLTFISTNETGALLAERLISGPLAGLSSQGALPYFNAGYLPGGQMGIREFAQNPSAAMPQLGGVTAFSQFSAFIIITDNADDARAWIEQTSSVRGPIPILVISSAQAAPMIQPYFESGQVNGLVAGLYGSAVLESNNSGGPGTARTYWDAFSVGMLLAMVFILGGGLLSLALGLRDRAAARVEK